MNLGVLQCKNCWRWGHATHSYKVQGVRYVKCSGPHKTKHHCQFGWYCKMNNKINSLQLETKKYFILKCSNCCGDHQADSNQCLFWKHRFNHKWHNKKQVKIHKNRNKLIYLVVSSTQAWFVRISKFFLKTFTRTVSLSILFSKHIQILTSFSSRSHPGHVFIWSQVHSIVKAKN